MPDLLILANDDKLAFELEVYAKSKGFRVKLAFNLKTTLEWLELKEFDVLVVSSGFDLEIQQDLADHLWQKNYQAALVIFDPAALPDRQQGLARLNGADVARGADAWRVLERILLGVKPRTYVRDQNLKVLVVEDLDSPRDIICAYLEAMGCAEVVGAASGREALKMLRADPKHFLCVLTDIRMPQMTGVELIGLIRDDPELQYLPIIVLTAYGTPDYLIDCLKAGASGFLVKPPKKKELLREIGRATRIVVRNIDPRLAAPDDIEMLREAIISRSTR